MSSDHESEWRINPKLFKGFATICVDLIQRLEGRVLDYSPESLLVVDNVINRHWPRDFFKGIEPSKAISLETISKGSERSGEFLTLLILIFGSYCGEVLIKSFGADWEKDEHCMFGWCVKTPLNLMFQVFHIADESLRESPKLYGTFLMAATYQKIIRDNGHDALKDPKLVADTFGNLLSSRMDFIKKVLGPEDKLPDYQFFLFPSGES
ncbi:MAG: hypothetical protein ACP5LN_09940 [Thermoproteota archaeon]